MEQMTNVFVQLFKTSITPSHKIWSVTFRPPTRRNGDVNFYALNDDVAMLLIDIGLDALGAHLPDALLTGPVPSTASQNLRSYHYDIVTNSLALCARREQSAPAMESVRKFRARLMKEGKPDEYTTEEAWNFQLTDSP
uniref:Uncharacterized protein n=2 Tax=Caenorhabditis japonica TaxID=281687 RepID=A0A8R1IGW0_CAEJA